MDLTIASFVGDATSRVPDAFDVTPARLSRSHRPFYASSVKAYSCRVCDAALYFENYRCVTCGTPQAYSREERAIVPRDDQDGYVDHRGTRWQVCANEAIAGCTWLTSTPGGLCFSCSLTRTRPADGDAVGMAQYLVAERAKRHVLVELEALGFPIDPHSADNPTGLRFDLLSSVEENVVIGHDDGLITIDLAESDVAHREKVRAQLDEPYRTMLGHFRHEIGHYFESVLVTGDLLDRARELFGDETQSYQDAIDRHYAEGPPDGWETSFISTYATMHPFEDFAETFAHYLHINETIDNARQFGLTVAAPVTAFSSFRDVVIGIWIPLSIALNQINRGMGKEPLYPFSIPDDVIDKLEFVASIVPAAR